jgi:hypothetical protein
VKNVLLVGDSTLNNGPVAHAIRESFVALGSNVPVFWGGKGVAPARHQGWPGAAFKDYAIQDSGYTLFEFTVTGASALEQDAYYTNNGSVFVVQDIYTSAGTGKIRCSRLSGANNPAASGTLVKVDGVGPGAISFSGVATVSPNPLWDTTGGVLSVANYRSNLSMGSTKFDVVTLRLGVNESFGEIKTEEDRLQVIAYAKTVIAAFVSDNASTKFIIELPTTDGNTRGGWAENYGAVGLKESYQANVWRLRELMLQEFDQGEYSANVSVCPTGCAVDRYFGYELSTVQSSDRVPSTEVRHTNAVHPATAGYYQLADAVFPHILKLIQ